MYVFEMAIAALKNAFHSFAPSEKSINLYSNRVRRIKKRVRDSSVFVILARGCGGTKVAFEGVEVNYGSYFKATFSSSFGSHGVE